MAIHSSVLAWRIPGTAEPGGLPSMGSHRVGHDWSSLAAAASPYINVCSYTCRSRMYVRNSDPIARVPWWPWPFPLQDKCKLGPLGDSCSFVSRVVFAFRKAAPFLITATHRAQAMFPSRQQTQPSLQPACELMFHPTFTCLEGLRCASNLLGVTGSEG